MKCSLCKKGSREFLEEGGVREDIDPRKTNHIHIMQVNKKGGVVWSNCYIGKYVPASRIEDTISEVGDALDRVKGSKSR